MQDHQDITTQRPQKPNPKYNIFQLAKIARRIPRAIARANKHIKNRKTPPSQIRHWLAVRHGAETLRPMLMKELFVRNVFGKAFKDARNPQHRRAELFRAQVVHVGLSAGF